MPVPATLSDSVELAKLLEPVALTHGYHIGIGGGTVNKEGERKDIDVIVYRRRDRRFAENCSPLTTMFKAFENFGVAFLSDLSDDNLERWCTKANWHGIPVDFLFPESPSGEYREEEPPKPVDPLEQIFASEDEIPF